MALFFVKIKNTLPKKCIFLLFANNMVGDIMCDKMFSRRAAICFFVITFLMLGCILRVAVLAVGNYEQVQIEQSTYRIKAADSRGTIYDCKMRPVTNNSTCILAAVSPTPQAIMGISSLLSGEELDRVLKTLKINKPAVCRVPYQIECDGIAFTKIYESTLDGTFASHIVGYTDSTGHGVSGLQYYYDELLYSKKGIEAQFTVNGRGEVLSGIEPTFNNDIKPISQGVVSTIDVDIQSVVENAAEGLTSGAVIIAEVKTAKIRAMVSMPQFDIYEVDKSLEASNSPLLNRALLSFSVGSAFKPCVAAAAIEEKAGGYTFNCKGSTHIIDRSFNCHKRDGHGLMDLRHALAFSCNCYFYNFAISVGAESIYKMASSLNFGSSIRIADGMKTNSGNLTRLQEISNDAVLANLSIGQGELLLSPVSMLTLYCAISGDGTYRLPTIVEKTIRGGKQAEYKLSSPTRVMKESTAALLRDYLSNVITEGTGIAAMPTLCTAAGKTATAQTGRYYENGTEITNSWFCGFFPAEKPQYVAIVMSDGATQKSTAGIFAEIADGVTKLSVS